MERQEFAIGRFRLQPGRRLQRDDATIALGPKPLSILTILVQAGGTIVTKDELMQKAWPGQVIEENALHAQISAVRKALGEDAGWVVTASGHGYSFSGPVETVEPEFLTEPAESAGAIETADPLLPPEPEPTVRIAVAGVSRAAPTNDVGRNRSWLRAGILVAMVAVLLVGATLATRHRSAPDPATAERLDRYAVLPFTNRTGESGNGNLASQLTDETAARLVNKAWHISVIDTKAALAEAGANVDEAALGRMLNLDYVVKGSLQRSEGKFEASVALIDAKSGVLLSSGHAEHDAEEQAALARWLAASVAIQVLSAADADRQNKLTAAPPARDAVPDLLDRARFVLEQKPPPDWFEAIPLVDKAVAAAPLNAQALYLSGAVRADLVEMSAYRDEMERQNFITIAERRLVEAEQAAPDKPAIHIELGMLRDHEGMRDAARAEYQRALDIDGASVAAHVQIALEELYVGHADTALTLLDQALPASAPTAFYVYYNRALVFVHLGQDEAALEAIHRAVAAEPEDPWVVLYLTGILQLVGQADEARQALAEVRKLCPRLTIARLRALDENTSPSYRTRQERLYDALMKAGLPGGAERAL